MPSPTRARPTPRTYTDATFAWSDFQTFLTHCTQFRSSRHSCDVCDNAERWQELIDAITFRLSVAFPERWESWFRDALEHAGLWENVGQPDGSVM